MTKPNGVEDGIAQIPIKQKKGIAIAIISGRGMCPVELVGNMMFQGWPTNSNVVVMRRYGQDIAEGRISCVKEAKKRNLKLMWFLDDDVVPPVDTSRHLIYAMERYGQSNGGKARVVAGVYCVRGTPPEPLVYKEQGAGPDWTWRVGEIIKRWGVGTGCMLVDLDVFDHLPEPWFKTTRGAQTRWSDDLHFCELVANAGFDTYVHGGVLCHHYDFERGAVYMLPRNSPPYVKRIPGSFAEPELPLAVDPAVVERSSEDVDLIKNDWMSERETRWLIDHAQKGEAFVEVGCWKGVTTRNLGIHAPQTRIYGIDNFMGSQEHHNPNSPNYEPRLKDEHWLFNECKENTQELQNVSILSMDSVGAAQMFKEMQIRPECVFIDASHEYDDVKTDIEVWLPIVKDGGILCGHDLNWPGVRRAVEELLPGAAPVAGTSIWMYEKAVT